MLGTRVAAASVAGRVAEEVGVELVQEVRVGCALGVCSKSWVHSCSWWRRSWVRPGRPCISLFVGGER